MYTISLLEILRFKTLKILVTFKMVYKFNNLGVL